MSYAKPETLVDTKWVEQHLNDPKVRIVEVDYDPTVNYQLGHAPGAVLWDWRKDLNHPVQRDILSREQLDELLGSREFLRTQRSYSTATSTIGSQPTHSGTYNTTAYTTSY